MTIYTVETGGTEGGGLRLATTDKREAYKLARQEFYRLILEQEDFNIWRGHNRNVKTQSAYFKWPVKRCKGLSWYADSEWVSLKIWK